MVRIARRVRQAGVYFVTTATWQRRPLFAKREVAAIVLEQLLSCRDRGFYRLHAFVIMPEHFHALITPGDETSLEKSVQMIKGGSGHRVRKELGFRWPVWQAGFHDRWIRDAAEYATRRDYIESNPVAAKLVERAADYSLSSAGNVFALDASKFDEPYFSG